MEDELLTVTEAAKRLKIHEVTLRGMLRSGQVRGMKFGARQWRIPSSSLQEFINGKMGPNPAEMAGKEK